MEAEFAALSDGELQRLAYARASTPEQQARAAAAGEELARRAAAAEAERRAAEPTAKAGQTGQAVDREAEHPEPSPDDAHHRRMRAVGLVGVLVAALALPGVGWALSLPDPDPLAIFDGQQDPADVALLTELIGPDAIAAITSGPQLARFDGGIVAIAFRASTVPDGRSTDWDAYCLLTTRDPESEEESGRMIAGNCVTPERFEAQGVIAAGGTVGEEDRSTVDAVVWGPEGSPRRERDLAIETQEWGGSVTDALAYGGLQSAGGAATPDIDGAERLVMGPAQIASSSTRDGSTLTVSAYLIESAVEGTQGLAPQYCLLVTADDDETSTECAALPLVEREGVSVQSSSSGENWLVEVGPDGSLRFDGF
ncbi:MAG: hypothetical protein CMF57_11130 [Leifsonia sp.]|nr:hypothetical protein [Leifsonia sp.]